MEAAKPTPQHPFHAKVQQLRQDVFAPAPPPEKNSAPFWKIPGLYISHVYNASTNAQNLKTLTAKHEIQERNTNQGLHAIQAEFDQHRIQTNTLTGRMIVIFLKKLRGIPLTEEELSYYETNRNVLRQWCSAFYGKDITFSKEEMAATNAPSTDHSGFGYSPMFGPQYGFGNGHFVSVYNR